MATATRGMQFRLGVLVVMAGGLLALLIFLFGSMPGLFKRTITYSIRFTDAPGLAPGAPVRRSGVKIGTVERITLDEEQGIVRVKVAIDSPYSIRKSEQPTLVAGLLGSDVGIDLIPREVEDREPVDRDPFEPNAEVLGAKGASVNTLIKGAADVVPTTQQTMNEIRKSVQRMEKFVARAEKTIPLTEETLRVYRDLGQDARKMLPEFQKTNAQIQRLARTAEDILPDVQKAARQVTETAKTAQELAPTIRTTLEEYRALGADIRKEIPNARSNLDDIGAASRNASRLFERADVMLQANQGKIERALDNLNKTLDGAGRLFSDDNVKKVNNILTNANTASDKLPSIANNADDLLRQGTQTLKRAGDTLTKLDEALTDAQRVLRPLGTRGERMVRNADEAIQRANDVLGDLQKRGGGLLSGFGDTNTKINLILDDVRALLRAIDKADGTFRRIIQDPSLYNNVDAATAMVLKIIPRVDRILKDFETFADKLARHPEAIGLGGVVRPGSGLKSPPTPPIVPQAPAHIGPPVQVHSPKR